jgi:hypothetical protein
LSVSLFTRAKRGQEKRYQATTRDVGQLMRLFGRTIAALSEAREGETDAIAVIDEAVGWHRLLAAKPQVDALAELAGGDMLVAAAERYATIRRFAPAFLDAFIFRAADAGTALMQAIETLRDLNRRNRREVPEGAPLPFQNKQWKRLVREDGRINRRLYETAVLSTLRDRLRAGDVWIDGTRNYRRFDAYLLSKREAIEVATELSIDTDANAYLAERARMLDWRLKGFSRTRASDRFVVAHKGPNLGPTDFEKSALLRNVVTGQRFRVGSSVHYLSDYPKGWAKCEFRPGFGGKDWRIYYGEAEPLWALQAAIRSKAWPRRGGS